MENFNYSLSNQTNSNYNFISPPSSPRKERFTPPSSPNKITSGNNLQLNEEYHTTLERLASIYNSQSFLAPSSPIKWGQPCSTRSYQTPPASPIKVLQKSGSLENQSPQQTSLSNIPKASPEKNTSPKKRLFQDENKPPLMEETPKRTRWSLQGESTRQLLKIITNFDDREWLKQYAETGHHNLSNEQILKAISEEKNPVKNQEYMKALATFKTNMLCLFWSILPDLEMHPAGQKLIDGYYETVNLAYIEHILQVYFSNKENNANFKSLLLENFKTAPFNCFPSKRKVQIIQDWKNDKPVSLNIGWKTHITSLIILKDLVAYGNKGTRHPSFGAEGIIFYRMTQPDSFNEIFIKQILKFSTNKNIKSQMDFLENGKMAKILGLVPIFRIPKSPQKDGYCTAAVCNLNIHSLIILSLLKDHEGDLPDDLIEDIQKKALPEYKTIKRFMHTYNLSQFAQLLFHPLAKDSIGKKDAYTIICNLQSKIRPAGKLEAFSPDQQKIISNFFKDFFEKVPLTLDDCVVEFKLSPQEIPSVANELIEDTQPGNFLIRQGTTKQSVIVHYIDQDGKVKSLTIKKVKGNFIYNNKTINHLQDLFDNKLTTPYLDHTKLRYLS